MEMTDWSVYIIECRTKDLYVGVSNDVIKRVKRHNDGLACRYTRFRGPVRLVYAEVCESYKVARKRESIIKKYSRVKKFNLINKSKTSHPAYAGFEVQNFTS